MKIKQNQLRSEIITVICTLLLLGTTLLVSPHLTQPAQQIISSQSPPHHSVATTEVWPTYAHDAAHSGYTSGIGPMTNQTFLQKQLLTDTSFMYTAGILGNGNLYFIGKTGWTDHSSFIRCVTADTGQLVWQNSSFNTLAPRGPALSGNALYLTDLVTGLYCLNALTGTLLWFYPRPDITTSPTVVDDYIYFGTTHKIFCITTEGTEVWNTTISSDNSPQTPPTVVNDRIYLVCTPYVYCFTTIHGDKVWEYNTHAPSMSASPAVSNGKVFVSTSDTLFCIDATGLSNGTTTVLWSITQPDTQLTAPAVTDSLVYFGSGTTVYCVHAQNGSEIWQFDTGGTLIDQGVTPAPISLADGKVYVGCTTDHSTLYCLNSGGENADSINVLWSYSNIPNEIVEQPLIANGKLWILCWNYWVYGFGTNNPPPAPTAPTGPTDGISGNEYTYATLPVLDPDSDTVYYEFDWGDGFTSGWITTPMATHVWITPGIYNVRVKAKDTFNAESDWSAAASLTITAQLPELVIEAPSSVMEGTNFSVTITTLTGRLVGNATIVFDLKTYRTDNNGTALLTAPFVTKNQYYLLLVNHTEYQPTSLMILILNQKEQQGWVYGVVTDTNGSLLQNVSLCITIQENPQGTISQCVSTDTQGQYVLSIAPGLYTMTAEKPGYKTITKENITIEVNKAIEVNFELEKEANPPTYYQQLIDQAIAEGTISATISLRTEKNIIRYQTSVYISEVNFTVTSTEQARLSILVSSDKSNGSTIVVEITDQTFSPEKLQILVNEGSIHPADSIEDVLNPRNDPTLEWFIQKKQTGTGFWLFISIPHFSHYHITLYQIIETISKTILGSIYGIIFILGLIAVFYIVIFSGTLRLPIKKKRR